MTRREMHKKIDRWIEGHGSENFADAMHAIIDALPTVAAPLELPDEIHVLCSDSGIILGMSRERVDMEHEGVRQFKDHQRATYIGCFRREDLFQQAPQS